jgi:hypothetical protein
MNQVVNVDRRGPLACSPVDMMDLRQDAMALRQAIDAICNKGVGAGPSVGRAMAHPRGTIDPS